MTKNNVSYFMENYVSTTTQNTRVEYLLVAYTIGQDRKMSTSSELDMLSVFNHQT